MNKTIFYLAALLSVAGLIGWYMYLQNARFAVVTTQKGIAYEIDKKSGESLTLYPGKREKNIGDDQKIERYHALPLEEKIKVIKVKPTSKPESLTDLLYGSFSGTLYNGSSWTVKEIIVAVKTIEKDGKIRSDRQFRNLVTIVPLTTERFSIITGDSDIGSFE